MLSIFLAKGPDATDHFYCVVQFEAPIPTIMLLPLLQQILSLEWMCRLVRNPEFSPRLTTLW
jgi:hypothetical protein